MYLEKWSPSRTRVTIKSINYPTYGINDLMNFAQARAAAKEYNLKENKQKSRDAKNLIQFQNMKLNNDFSLPANLVSAFCEELHAEYKNNPDRLRTLEQHWKTSKVMILKINLCYNDFYNKRFSIFEYYESKYWSADYIKRITKITNRWGFFCARRNGAFFEPIPKIGIRIQQIVKNRETKSDIRRAATPLLWSELKILRSTFENEELTKHWNWMYIGLFFGLRPSEIDSLIDTTRYRIEYNTENKVQVLLVYQNKLKNLAEYKRWKIIPIVEVEQIEALMFIKACEFKRPLNKTLKRLFKTTGIDSYSPRKGFTDLFLSRDYQLEDISTFLGHTSIETTWRHYKNKLAFKLPKTK